MRILYVITRADAVGGASVHVCDLAAAMQSRGREVKVLIGGTGPVTKLLQEHGIQFEVLPHLTRRPSPANDLLALRELRQAVHFFSPDLVSLHTAKAGWLGRMACRSMRVPVVYTPHGWSVAGRFRWPMGHLFTALERIAAKYCEAIVCVCEFEREVAVAKKIAPPWKVRVIPNGVRDVPDVLRAAAEREPPRLVTVARMQPPKDPGLLVRALEKVRELDWELDCIGDGPLLGKTRRVLESSALGSRVRFWGYVREPAEILARAQVFVLSSRFEALPRSILEAMRAGLPVIAPRLGGIQEAVRDGRNGLLYEPGNAQSLASALRALIVDPVARKRMGTVGRQLYQERFTLERLVRETEALYAQLTAGGFLQGPAS